MDRLVAVMTLFFAAALSAAEPEPVFRWQREVERPPITETALVAAPLDSHFFANTRDGWPDVRLRTADDRAAAILIQRTTAVTDRTVREFWTAEQTAATVNAEHGLQIDVLLGEKEPLPHGVRVVSPLRDFEHQAYVESSVDGATWEPAGEPTLLFDYSRFVDARHDTVPFAAGSRRRFRLTIADVSAEQESQLLELHRRLSGGAETERTERTTIARRPFRVDRIEFYRDIPRPESSETKTVEFPVASFAVEEHAENQQTIVTFETQREPLTAVEVVAATENFSRAARLETERADARGVFGWQPLASGTLTRFAVGDIQRRELSIPVPETQSVKYRLVIDNRDSPPIGVTAVKAVGPLYEIRFLAEPEQTYTLVYGSPEADAGRYDTAALQAALDRRHAATPATLSAPRENPNAPAMRRPWAPWNDLRLLMGGIVLLTLLLGYVLYLVGRDLKAEGDSPLKPPQ